MSEILRIFISTRHKKSLLAFCKIIGIPSVFSFFYFNQTLFQKAALCWIEEPYELAVRRLAIESFKNFTLPLWNPMIGPGGHHAVAFSTIVWDYRLFLFSIFDNYNYTLFVDMLLLVIAYVFCVSTLMKGYRFSIIAALLGFMYFYNSGMVSYWVPINKHNAVFISFLFLTGLIYKFEDEKKNSTLLGMGLAYWFSMHGGRIDYWFQMNVILVFTALVCRTFHTKSLNSTRDYIDTFLLNPVNKKYVLVFLLVLFSHFWDLHWLQVIISETGRFSSTSFQTFSELVGEFLLTFHYSYVFNFYLLYLMVTLPVIIGRSVYLKGWGNTQILPISFLAILPILYSWSGMDSPLKWASEEIILIGKNTPLTTLFVLSFALAYILSLIKYFRDATPSKNILLLQLPILTLMILHFLFEDQRINWGPARIEGLDIRIIGMVVLFSFPAVFLKNRNILNLSLALLAVNYLLRAHVQLATMRIWNFPWHVQRDDLYFSFWLSVLFVLGALHVLSFLRTWLQINKVVLAGASFMVFLWAFDDLNKLAHTQDYFSVSCIHQLDADVPRMTAIVEALNHHSGTTEYKHAVIRATQYWPGYLADKKIIVPGIFDNTISKYFKDFMYKYAIARRLNPNARCNFNYIFFPSNLHKVFNCHYNSRFYYGSHSVNGISMPYTKEFLSDMNISFVITESEFNQPHLKLLEEFYPNTRIYEFVEDPIEHQSQQTRNYSDPSRYVSFRSNNAIKEDNDCADSEKAVWNSIDASSDIYSDKPILRDKYLFEINAPEKGCALIKLGYSSLWIFKVNGKTIKPGLAEEMFMTIPVEKGKNSIAAIYHPYIKFEILFSILVFIMGVIWGIKRLSRERNK